MITNNEQQWTVYGYDFIPIGYTQNAECITYHNHWLDLLHPLARSSQVTRKCETGLSARLVAMIFTQEMYKNRYSCPRNPIMSYIILLHIDQAIMSHTIELRLIHHAAPVPLWAISLWQAAKGLPPLLPAFTAPLKLRTDRLLMIGYWVRDNEQFSIKINAWHMLVHGTAEADNDIMIVLCTVAGWLTIKVTVASCRLPTASFGQSLWLDNLGSAASISNDSHAASHHLFHIKARKSVTSILWVSCY